VRKQLEHWKNSLIDFSKRNQLLYFSPRSSLSIELTEDPQTIFRKLVLEGKALVFKDSPPLHNIEAPPEEDFSDTDFSQDEDFDYQPTLDNQVNLENFLMTDKDERSLLLTLNKLRSRSKGSLVEQGINILYLALYFLEWAEANSPSSDKAKSPLLLIPVALDRQGLNGTYSLNLLEDEIRINPTLAYKLQRDYGIELQSIEDKLAGLESAENLSTLITDIKDATSSRQTQDWKILEEASLSLFSFNKLSLYKDLEINEKKIINHPVVRRIAGEPVTEEEINPTLKKYLVKAEDIDTLIDANEANQILDADSSQQEAIYAAKAGESFVLQGPPGTGKSQTIANIISEALARNKKILFISEKKAALDVVAKRLKESKLDNFCLELHGSDQKKSEIMQGIRSSLEEIKSMAVDSRRESYIEAINKVKEQIQKGIDELHAIRQPINMSLYEIYGELSRLNLNLKDYSELSFTIKNLEKLDAKEISDLDYFFTQLEKKSEIINNYGDFIWRNADVAQLSFEFENQIKSNFIEFKSIALRLQSYASLIASRYFGRNVSNIKEFKWLAESSQLALESPFPKRDWFDGKSLESLKSLTLRAKLEHEEYSVTKDKILTRYSESFLKLDHIDLLGKFSSEYQSIFRFFNLNYWKDIGQLKKFALYNEVKDLQAVISDLEEAVMLDKQAMTLRKDEANLSLNLGDFYKKFDTDWNETLTAMQWVQKILTKMDTVPTALLNVVSDTHSEDGFEEFERQARDLIAANELLKYHLKFYRSIFPVPNIDIETISFDDLSNHLEQLILKIIKVEDWIEFKQLRDKAKSLGIEQFVDALIAADTREQDPKLKERFLKKFYQAWVDKIEIENPHMRKFSGQEQALLIEKFKDLDLKQIEKVKLELAKKLSLIWIEYASNTLNQEAIQVLNQELNKKKRHKPMRLLLKEIPELLQTLKPCWMMSPLTVSQFVDSSKNLDFDLVIFDEASQIRTEDAIPSIYRGKQLILAGDSQQLPPTNFFHYIDDKDDDYDNDSFESILDECAVFLKNRTLNWHYRSRHESLIEFSNYHIYDHRLISFPSPASTDFGVCFEFIDDAYYERGARFNRKEAKHLAQAVIDHYKNHPDLSLGVIAFSESQQMAIERELAALLRKEPDYDKFFIDNENTSDPFFIKNLENVQGDERDVIFFSIGYARDRKGNLSHNFGPLNREGGHRRLNVAITRARNKLKVFSSITANDIDINRTSAQGALLLKKYLSYAQNPSANDSCEIKEKPPTQPEESIAQALESRGYKVERSLGSSDYKIDIAVYSNQIVNEAPERAKFALAIETDGLMYKSAKTSRDRERLRKQVLETLGWRAHRVWARDWVRNPDMELEKIIHLLIK
jgi:superfamily I DNA and/or RNA helicase/very-short-patch-repair endonuclease